MPARVTLLGGLNEVGGNKFLLEEGDDAILLDFGTSIGARNLYFELPFLQPRTNSTLRDLLRLGLLPDLDGIYRDDLLSVARAATDRDLPESAPAWRRRNGGRDRVHGVILTHAHVDHFQDIAFLDPEIPVHCTATTASMIRAIEDVKSADIEAEVASVRERSLDRTSPGSTFPDRATVATDARARRFVEVDEQRAFRVGPFEVTAIPVDHSVPGACAFLVKTPTGKRVFYTGDIRFHGRLVERTAALLKAADGLEPDLMLCEGTRMGSEARDGEDDVERGVADLVRSTEGLAVCEFGWKDTTRFDTVQRVAEATGRTLLVDPRLAFMLDRLQERDDVPSTRIEDYRNVAVYRRRKGTLLGEPGDYDKHEAGYLADWGDRSADMKRAWRERDEGYLGRALKHWRDGVTAEKVRENPSRYLVQLTYYGSSELFDLAPPPGSSWVRCTTEPYTEEQDFTMDRQRRWLDHFGMRHNVPRTDHGDAGVLKVGGVVTHVSGHGGRPDLERIVRLARPKRLVPVHTSEENLDRFQALGFDTAVFRGAGFRDAGLGRCAVEF